MGIDVNEVIIKDQGLARYINLETNVKSLGRHSSKIFGKSKVNLVERLTNDMMRSKSSQGKNPRPK